MILGYEYFTETTRVLKNYIGVLEKHSVFQGEYSMVVLRYSDSSTSTTDEYSKVGSTREFSRHVLA